MQYHNTKDLVHKLRFAVKEIDKDVLLNKQGLKELAKRIGKIEQRLLRLEAAECKCDAVSQQAIEEVLFSPRLPYDPDHYTMPPVTKDDSIFKSEEEVFGPKKKRS